MELKPYEAMCETTTEHLKQLINGGNQADAEEILSVAKVLGEITDVKKDIVEMCYKKQILEAMEDSDYEEYRQNVRNYAEPFRGKMMMDDDMSERDMQMPKKMYYTSSNSGSNNSGRGGNMNGNMSRDSREGHSGEMRRNFVESKEMHGKDSDEMENLEEYLNTLDSDMMQLKTDMTQAEKQMAFNKLNSLAQKVKP